MKGFIVTSMNNKNLKQSIGLESQVVRYTPVIGENQETIAQQHKEAFPDYTIIMIMPIEILKKNIDIIEMIKKQNDLVLE